MTTKEKIAYEALKLFSIEGYNSVSIRDISKNVGIKESSLYNHFKNKQSIFDYIVKENYLCADRNFKEKFMHIFEKIAAGYSFNIEDLNNVIIQIFEFYFDDECNKMFRKMLTIGQFCNCGLKKMFKELYHEQPLKIITYLFDQLINLNQIKNAGSAAMAIEFYSPIYVMLITTDSLKESLPTIKEHFNLFANNYKK